VFHPIRVDKMSKTEIKHAMGGLMFLVQKRCGRIKARTCANESTQCEDIIIDEASSPTVSHEATIITGVIEAKQQRNIMTSDISNAFVQIDIDQSGEKIIIIKRGELVDILLEVSPDIHSKHFVNENGQNVLHIQMMKALYGMMVSSLLYYKKFLKDIESVGLEVNPYDMCVANRIINGRQNTITWHLAMRIESSMYEFLDCLKDKYVNDSIGEVQAKRFTKHNYF